MLRAQVCAKRLLILVEAEALASFSTPETLLPPGDQHSVSSSFTDDCRACLLDHFQITLADRVRWPNDEIHHRMNAPNNRNRNKAPPSSILCCVATANPGRQRLDIS